jgi:hypothetical protein
MSQGNIISTPPKLWAGRPGVQTQVGARDLSRLKMSSPNIEPTQPPIPCVMKLFLSGKAAKAWS